MSQHATSDLSAVAQVLEDLRLVRLSMTEIAKTTGHATSAITRDRVNKAVIDWPARDVLLLARANADARTAVSAFINNQVVPSGDDRRVPSDLITEAVDSGAVGSRIREAMADGELSCRDIDGIVDALERRTRDDSQLISDLFKLRKRARA